MIDNFTKHQKIIDDLSGQVNSKDFEAKFSAKSSHIPKTERFLLKMEIKRLATPCGRLVDLRGLVDGECRSYEHEDRVHYLDDVAIHVFEEGVANYGGYTLGVYEAVTNTENNFRVIYQKEKAGLNATPEKKAKEDKVFEKAQYPAQLFKFGEYYNRKEERMNFSIPVLIHYQGDKFEANSSDLSVNGCKFRVAATAKMQLGQVISIRFLGLEEEFAFGSSGAFEYEVKNIQLVDNIQLVGTHRVYKDNSSKDGFQQFLTGFIQGNKRRYKINLDNSISAILTRNIEQYVLPKSNELPVFVSGKESQVIPKYALTCINNHHIVEYWQDENKQSTLHFLLTPKRVQRLTKLSALGKSLIVYSFIHKSQGKFYFYSADDEQFKDDPSFMAEFLSFAANKSDFAVNLLSVATMNKDRANSFYTLSESITVKNQYLNLPVSDENLQKIDELSQLIVISDITHESLIENYKVLASGKIEATKIKVFGHKRGGELSPVEYIGINYQNHRQESRFKFKTAVDVLVNNSLLAAESLDFSASGLKLEFKEEVPLNKGDVVHLSFPDLQKITSSFDLKALPYLIVRVNEKKTIINLRVYIDKHMHIGKSFFKALIEKNKNKLTPDEYASMVQGLVKPLRNIYSSANNIPSIIIQTSGSRYKVEAICCGQEQGKIMPLMRQLSDKVGHYNLSPILSNLNLTNALMVKLKKMQSTDAPLTHILYVAINPDAQRVEDKVITKDSSELASLEMQSFFIRNALKKGVFLCLQLKMSRSNVPDMDYLNPELNYISSYAIHRGKQIEQEIWSVAGVAQVFDMTQEAMLRVKLAV